MKFQLPDTLPTTSVELGRLADDAKAEIAVYNARKAAGDEFTAADVDRLEYLVNAVDTIAGAQAAAVETETAEADRMAGLLDRAAATTQPAETEAPADTDVAPEVTEEAAAEVVAEAEAATADAAVAVVAAAPAPKPVSFAHAAPTTVPDTRPTTPSWELLPSAASFRAGEGPVGFRRIAEAMDSVKPGSMMGVQRTGTMAGQAIQAFAQLRRDIGEPVSEDLHEVYATLERVTSHVPGRGKVTAESLTAAGGWCSPSERAYDFCATPDPVNLLSMPEIPVSRGGIIFPEEPDFSAFFTNDAYLFNFTEPELEADPAPEKQCIEIPCDITWKEHRLKAIGYCLTAGILQLQGWPELIEKYLREFAAQHLRSLSLISIRDIEAGSQTVQIPATSVIGTAASIVNSLALQATNIRIHERLSDTAVVEAIAPVWLREVIRADMAFRDGAASLGVTDAQINSLFTARNIAVQFVSDWQAHQPGQLGDLATNRWPTSVRVLMYKAGAWFRSMNEVITIGTAYPMDLVRFNRYQAIFTEDAYLVGSRCGASLNIEIPICVNGAIGDRQAIAC